MPPLAHACGDRCAPARYAPRARGRRQESWGEVPWSRAVVAADRLMGRTCHWPASVGPGFVRSSLLTPAVCGQSCSVWTRRRLQHCTVGEQTFTYRPVIIECTAYQYGETIQVRSTSHA